MAVVFPSSSLSVFGTVANMGLVLFMFCVGLELDFAVMRQNLRKSFLISAAGILLPFGIGTAVGLAIMYKYPLPPHASLSTYLLFIGTAMSITAFPVLARILSEQRLLGTRLGSSCMNAAAVDDVVAWSILSIVIALARAVSGLTALWTILSTLAFVLGMMYLVRPAVDSLLTGRVNPARWLRRLRRSLKSAVGWPSPASSLLADVSSSGSQGHIHVSHTTLAFTVAVVFLCAWTTELLGVHAIFGAFVAGAATPRTRQLHVGLAEKMEDLVVALLLPMYFTYSGLKTEFNALDDGAAWGLVLLVIAAATLGKLGGCSVAARITGLNWRESVGVGIFMNAKGLVELIVLNVGLDIGVISKPVFSVFVSKQCGWAAC